MVVGCIRWRGQEFEKRLAIDGFSNCRIFGFQIRQSENSAIRQSEFSLHELHKQNTGNRAKHKTDQLAEKNSSLYTWDFQ
jgi:hypothetical protein